MGALRLVEEKFYTIEEVAELLGVTRFSIYNFMKQEGESKLNYITIGKRRRIAESELQRYINNNKK